MVRDVCTDQRIWIMCDYFWTGARSRKLDYDYNCTAVTAVPTWMLSPVKDLIQSGYSSQSVNVYVTDSRLAILIS